MNATPQNIYPIYRCTHLLYPAPAVFHIPGIHKSYSYIPASQLFALPCLATCRLSCMSISFTDFHYIRTNRPQHSPPWATIIHPHQQHANTSARTHVCPVRDRQGDDARQQLDGPCPLRGQGECPPQTPPVTNIGIHADCSLFVIRHH
jgi:hypothetical protein